MRMTKIVLCSLTFLGGSYGTTFAENLNSTDDEVVHNDSVIVVGTKNITRKSEKAISPVDIITAKQIAETGSNTLPDILARVIPSFSYPQAAVASGFETVRPVTMHGLSPDQILVLIDGKRQHVGAMINSGSAIGRGSNPVDLNAIPISSIDRIEVLHDGSSSRYGSDAIGGVVNIVLKKENTQNSITADAGGYTQGDGLHRQIAGSYALSFLKHGGVRFSGEFKKNDYTNDSGINHLASTIGTPIYGKRIYRLGDPAVMSGKFVVNYQYTFSKNISAYGFTMYRHDDANSSMVYVNPSSSSNVPSIYPNGYLPLIKPVIQDISTVFGFKGEIYDKWNYDLSINHGFNSYHANYDQINSAYYNDYGYTPTNINGATYKYTQDVLNFDVSKTIKIPFLRNPFRFSAGMEYMWSRDTISPGDIYSQYGSGGSITGDSYGSWGRRSLAEYAKLDTNFTDKLSNSFSVRHEKYSDLGNNVSGSVSLRYELTPRIAFRTTLATAFRAPSLAQEHYASISTMHIDADTVTQTGTFPVTSQVAKLLGASPLKAETSKSITAGAIVHPLKNWSITVDGYYIRINNRINLSSDLNVSGNMAREYLQSQGVATSYDRVRYYTNAVDTLTSGVDLTTNYRVNINKNSNILLNLAYSYNKNHVIDVHDSPSILKTLGVAGTLVERREHYGLLEDTNPKNKILMSANYKINKEISTLLKINRYGSYRVFSNSGSQYDQTFGARWTVDLSFTYSLPKWNFVIGSNNIFGTRPEPNKYANSLSGNYKYNIYSPLTWNGRYVYASVSYIL